MGGMCLSVLDVSPVASGSSGAGALQRSTELAKFTDELGFKRYWLAEHHNAPLMASSAPHVMAEHIAGATQAIRVGSGGVMLRNYAPLHVAEAFRTLEALHPGRVDLGIGRAAGADALTAKAMMQRSDSEQDFQSLIEELLGFLSDSFPEDHPFRHIVAVPTGVPAPELWILGSNKSTALLAARMGLRFAFAHLFQPAAAVDALRAYASCFCPSAYLDKPTALIAVSAVCAETDAIAADLALPVQLALVRMQQGQLSPLSTVDEASAYAFSQRERELIEAGRNRLFIGSPGTLRNQLTNLAAQAAVSEIMISTWMHDHNHRRRSYELLAKAFEIRKPLI